MTVRFDTAMGALIKWLKNHSSALPQGDLVIVRDLRGQVRIIAESSEATDWTSAHEDEVSDLLGSY